MSASNSEWRASATCARWRRLDCARHHVQGAERRLHGGPGVCDCGQRELPGAGAVDLLEAADDRRAQSRAWSSARCRRVTLIWLSPTIQIDILKHEAAIVPAAQSRPRDHPAVLSDCRRRLTAEARSGRGHALRRTGAAAARRCQVIATLPPRILLSPLLDPPRRVARRWCSTPSLRRPAPSRHRPAHAGFAAPGHDARVLSWPRGARRRPARQRPPGLHATRRSRSRRTRVLGQPWPVADSAWRRRCGGGADRSCAGPGTGEIRRSRCWLVGWRLRAGSSIAGSNSSNARRNSIPPALRRSLRASRRKFERARADAWLDAAKRSALRRPA